MPPLRTYRYIVKLPRGEAGQSLIELALVLPILVFLLMGGVDLARAYSAQVGVLNAARAAAEAGATETASTVAAIQAYATDELRRVPGLSAATPTVTVTGCCASGALTVRVQHTFNPLIAWPLVPNQLALDRSATFRQYTP